MRYMTIKDVLTNIIVALVAALLTGGGSYVAFAQKVERIEQTKADISIVHEVKEGLVKVSTQMEESAKTAAELKAAIEKSSDKQDARAEKLREKIELNATQQAEMIGQIKALIENLNKGTP